MLNREHLQYSRNSGRISVRFLKNTPADKIIAGALLDIYQEAAAKQLGHFAIDAVDFLTGKGESLVGGGHGYLLSGWG